MQYNVLKGALWEVNTTEGNKSLDFNELYALSDYDDTPVTGLTETDVLVLDFDFGHRLHLDRVEYKFISSDADSVAVASGVEFFYKDDSFESYVPLVVSVTVSGIFSATSLSGIFAPRYVRMSHTLSETYGATTISGNVYGFKAFNNDTVVDFGADGTQTTEYIQMARGGAADIRAIPIYNSGTTLADAYINLQPTFSDLDNAIFVSNNEDGPWVKSLDPGNLIADDVSFDAGITNNLEHFIGHLRIIGVDVQDAHYISNLAEGTYTTRVFSKGDTYCRFVIDKYKNRNGHVVVNRGDPVETIEIRSHNAPPKPYAIIRELYSFSDSQYHYLSYRDRWLENQSIKESSTWVMIRGSRFLRSTFKDYGVIFDQLTERWAGFINQSSGHGATRSNLTIFNNVGNNSTFFDIADTNIGEQLNFSWRETKFTSSGGIWVYFFCQQSATPTNFVDNTGYYLAYFDSDLNNLFKWWTPNEEIGTMDVNYTTRHIWYTRNTTNAIYKVSNIGVIEVNFMNKDVAYKLGGIAVMPDDGVIYANDKDLHRLKYNGLYLAEHFIGNVADDLITYISLDGDGDEAIWVIDGFTVGRLFVSGDKKGTYDFKVKVDYPVRMQSVEGGVWVTCIDMGSSSKIVMCFISKENRRVDVEFSPNFNSSPGILYEPYTHDNYSNKMPILIDPFWSVMDWDTISTGGYLSSEDNYYQLRLTFRRQEPIERYPEFVTNPNQDFITDDNFDQGSSTPNQLLWGDWKNKPALDRVYVDPVVNGLILVPDTDPRAEDAFVSTRERMVGNVFEIRVEYKFGVGNGVESGLPENLYIYAYSVEPNFENVWMAGRMYKWPNSDSWSKYVGTSVAGWTNSNHGNGLHMYEGTMSLSWDKINVSMNAIPMGSSWSHGIGRGASPSVVGNYFYFQIVGSKNSSELLIKKFDFYTGNPYYYTDSPRVSSIYKQELIEIKDIYPNNHKDVYIRTFIPSNSVFKSNYEMDLKARWRVSTY